jgi:hypothetical protein
VIILKFKNKEHFFWWSLNTGFIDIKWSMNGNKNKGNAKRGVSPRLKI